MIARVAVVAIWTLAAVVGVQIVVVGFFVLNPSHCAGYVWHPLPCSWHLLQH